MATDTLSADTRYTFTIQFLQAAALFARQARRLETQVDLPEEKQVEHRGLVSTAIMQCAAALETEAHEICTYGPGAYVRGNASLDPEIQCYLVPHGPMIERQETLARYELILSLLRKTPTPRHSEPYQSARQVVKLRNELIHYKSSWGEEMSREKFFQALERLGHSPPPFTDRSMNYFPHRCLSAECAGWAVRSTVASLEAIYKALEVPSRFSATLLNSLDT